MAGKRLIDNSLTNTTYPEAVSNNAEILTDWEGLVWARPIPLKLVGNAWWQGSYDSITWDNYIKDDHTITRVSTDGGETWLNFVLSGDTPETHPPLTLGNPTGGLQLDEVNQVLTLNEVTVIEPGAMSPSDKIKLDALKFDFLENIGGGYSLYKEYTDNVDVRTHKIRTLVPGLGISINYIGDTLEISAGGSGTGVDNQGRNIGLDGISIFHANNSPYIDFRAVRSVHEGLMIAYDSVAKTVDYSIKEDGIDHNLLLNYEINNHIDHSLVSILTTEGIKGGGDLTETRTLTFDFPGLPQKIVIEDTDLLAIYDPNQAQHYHINYANLIDGVTEVHNTYYVPLTTSVFTGLGLTGGGSLDQDRTIRLAFQNLSTVTPALEDYFPIYDISNLNHAKVTLESIIDLAQTTLIFDNYQQWKLGVNGDTPIEILSNDTVDFTGSGTVTVSRVGKNVTITGTGGGTSGLSEIQFEFCVTPGLAETFTLDIYASRDYIIDKAVLESDGTLNNVSININNNPITGLSGLSVSTLSVNTATGLNTVILGNRITLKTTTSYSGDPSIIRGKIILA